MLTENRRIRLPARTSPKAASSLIPLFWLWGLMWNAAASAQDNGPVFDGEAIRVDAALAGTPVKFLYDTGSSASAVFSNAAARAGLVLATRREERVAGHALPVWFSEPTGVRMFGRETRAAVRVLDVPGPPGLDGVFGWRDLVVPALLLDGVNRQVTRVEAAPGEGWQRWDLDRDSSQVFFSITSEGKPLGRVFLDTGSPAGLRLSPPLWREWRRKNPAAGVTLETFRYMVGEVRVHELAWASEYALGDLRVRQVDIGPIPEAPEEGAIDASGRPYLATLGMGALRRMRMILRPGAGEVLTQTVPDAAPHNRAGAVFTRGPGPESAWRARVLPHGPAGRAGLREGDALLELNGVRLDAQSSPPELLFRRLPGTEVRMTVLRAGAEHPLEFRLEDMIGPNVANPAP